MHKYSLGTDENAVTSISIKRPFSSGDARHERNNPSLELDSEQAYPPAKKAKTNGKLTGSSKAHEPRAGPSKNGWHDAPGSRPSAMASGSGSRMQGLASERAPVTRLDEAPRTNGVSSVLFGILFAG